MVFRTLQIRCHNLCGIRWLTHRRLLRNGLNQFPHAIEKLLGYTAILGTVILQMLTFSILDGGAVQLVIDPALSAERNIHLILPR